MGNYQSYESNEAELNLKYLNLSKPLGPADYLKHIQDECLEECLHSIPLDTIYYDTISMYEEVNFSFNHISFVPEEFSLRVPHLRQLNISHNQLASLPNSFHLLLHLRILDVSYNKMEVFPETITKLPKLNCLNISNNALKELPTSISDLQKLSKLNASHNKLRTLPETLVDCSELKVIVTLCNSLVHPPQAVCDQGTFFTLEHLMKSRLNSSPPKIMTSLSGNLSNSIFVRMRGQQGMASVSNPESASVEYKQAQGSSRTNKRKCPLMLPDLATTLAPDQLREAILGLVYGACIGDAICLNTENMARDECLFFYSSDEFNLHDRITDSLRSHFPSNDWSSNVDVMLLTLESLIRWGGVVDELEMVPQIMQWKVHGLADIDPFPGYPLSALFCQVIKCEGFSCHPHSTAETFYRKIINEQLRGLKSDTNVNDNSCLPGSLVLGIPNFFKDNEVVMNAERICKTTHASPLALSSSVFISLLAAAILQGKFLQKSDGFKSILEEVKNKVLDTFPGDKLNLEFDKVFQMDKSLHCASNDVMLTIRYVLTALGNVDDGFEKILSMTAMFGGQGIAAHGCVIGGILGAYYGYSELPQKWLRELPEKNIAWLNIKLNQLLDLFGLP